MKSLNIFARGLLSFAFEGMQFARLCAYLRHHSPVAQIGYSIFVFDLSDEEIQSRALRTARGVDPRSLRRRLLGLIERGLETYEKQHRLAAG